MTIGEIEISSELDENGDLMIQYFEHDVCSYNRTHINKQKAIELIEHLMDVFSIDSLIS